MRKDLLNGLSEEQIRKAQECKNQAELLDLAKNEGVELTDEQLAVVSGGGLICSTPTFTCPECGSTKVKAYSQSGALSNYWCCTCKECGHEWKVY